MPTGTITRFFTQQGFGYITPDNSDGDYIVVVDAAACSPMCNVSEGSRVTFEEGDATNGLRAANVELLEATDH
ncbi:MAG: cold shock domain-containing protein [Phycisphaerales bacterium]|nr:cold shock domain-containing protein [Phycisphaerales bacterium]